MPKRILTEKQERLLTEERGLLTDLQVILARHDASRDDQKVLERSIRQLDELFLIVVAGEFNSGKSTFINALLGTRLLDEGVTPTTTRIHTLAYGGETASEVDDEGIQHVQAPVELLREVHIVDTPGTNALAREHEAITQRYIPRSDIVLFVTSADRAFTESERAFIEQIRGWGKKLVFVINKADILRSADETAEIERFVVENAQRLLGFSPEVFSLSSRQALEAKLAGTYDGAPRQESRFAGRGRRISSIPWTKTSACGSSCSTPWVWASNWPTGTRRLLREGWTSSPTTSPRSTASIVSSISTARTSPVSSASA